MPEPASTTAQTPRGRVPAAAPVSLWNIANLLTGLRLLLVLPFGLVLFAAGGHATGWRVAAAAVFVVASATDRVDGQVARRYGLVTDLGAFVDPLADKVLTGTALVGLSLLGDVTWWLTVLIVVREVAVTAIRSAVARIAVIPASKGGKAKTVLLTVGLTLVILPIGGVVLTAAAIVSTITGVDYAMRAARLVRSR